jgi:hypothetical protein
MERKSAYINKEVMKRVRKHSHMHMRTNKEGMIVLKAISTVLKTAIKKRMAIDFLMFVITPRLVYYRTYLRHVIRYHKYF